MISLVSEQTSMPQNNISWILAPLKYVFQGISLAKQFIVGKLYFCCSIFKMLEMDLGLLMTLNLPSTYNCFMLFV